MTRHKHIVGQMLTACIRMDGSLRGLLADHGGPPRGLTELAVLHRVPGAAARGLREAGYVPDDELRRAHFVTVHSHLRVLADLRGLAPLLDALGTPWVVVKGPVLAETAYVDSDRRTYLDLDVLVSASDVEKVFMSLAATGAAVVDQNWPLACERAFGELHLQLARGTGIDLHWHLLNQRSLRRAFLLDIKELLDRRRWLTIRGMEIPALDPSAALSYGALHAALAGGHRLVWLQDIDQQVRHDAPDWDDFLDCCRRWRITIPVGFMLARAQRALSTPLPHGLVPSLLGRGWQSVSAAVDRLSPAVHAGEAGSLCRLTARGLRGSGWASAGALARRSAAAVIGRIHTDDTPAPSILDELGTEGDRRRYFEIVRTEAVCTGRP